MYPPLPAHVPLAVALRGDAVESIHHGSVAVVDGDGRLLFAAGDPRALTFTRSALKPLQALPFVRDGGPERFGFSEAQVALPCASRSGEPRHVEAVAGMLSRAGNAAGDLACRAHAPQAIGVRSRGPGGGDQGCPWSKRGCSRPSWPSWTSSGCSTSRRARLATLREPTLTNARGRATGVVRP